MSSNKRIKKDEIKKLEREVFEKFVIAGLCLITIPAWDKFIKHFFQLLFGNVNTLTSEFFYALGVTLVAAVLGVIFLALIVKTRK